MPKLKPKLVPPEKDIQKDPKGDDYDKFEHANASCMTDCTGLMPTPPQTEAEAESYMEIYDYGPPPAEE